MTGRGLMEYEDKKMIYEGDFINGNMTGKGKMVFSNGLRYEGEWSDDQMMGEGVLNFGDGRVVKGAWVESNLIDGEMFREIYNDP